MLVNLGNNGTNNRCVHEFWRAYLEKKLKSYSSNFKFVDGGRVDIGQYKFASKIGFCFDKCKCLKTVIHEIYKNEDYYSKSYITTYRQLSQLKKQIPNLFDDSRWVVKKSNSYGGDGVIPFSSWNKILSKNVTGSAPFVLQKEIVPALYQGYKFDIRPHVLIVKQHNEYEAYFMDYGIAKIQKAKFSSTSSQGFTTNLSGNATHEFYTTFLENYDAENYEENLEKFMEVTKETSERFVEFISSKNRAYFRNKREPPYQLMIMGYDIMFDKDNKAYLLETNNYSGFLVRGTRSKYKKQKEAEMVNKIWEKVLVPWIHNNNHTIDNDSYFTKFV